MRTKYLLVLVPETKTTMLEFQHVISKSKEDKIKAMINETFTSNISKYFPFILVQFLFHLWCFVETIDYFPPDTTNTVKLRSWIQNIDFPNRPPCYEREPDKNALAWFLDLIAGSVPNYFHEMPPSASKLQLILNRG